MDDERLIENAAMCCQRKMLIDDESVKECIVLNICKPLRAEIESLRAERDEMKKELGNERELVEQLLDADPSMRPVVDKVRATMKGEE